MRQWPRGIRKDQADVWLRDAGPSRELLQGYTHGKLPWDDFAQRYRREMLDERAWILDRLRHLEQEHGVVTLLCHERIPPAEHCHREILVDLLSAGSARTPATDPSDP
jgi:uncharacterized protein YeaO (DUF488 family)